MTTVDSLGCYLVASMDISTVEPMAVRMVELRVAMMAILSVELKVRLKVEN